MKTHHLLALCLSLAAMACATTTPSSTATPATTAEAPAPPPAVSTVPGADVINGETCIDDAWLLTHYDVPRLASGSSPAPGTGYPTECCAEGVLKDGDAWRCELDWPSSDVVHCSAWTEYHDTLAAAHPAGARSERVRNNLETLTRWVGEQHHCSLDE